MRNFIILSMILNLCSCKQEVLTMNAEESIRLDSLQLTKMIAVRENAMINKDIKTAVSQFTEDVTWINSQGYFFEGKREVRKFHNMLANNDSLDYYYKAGNPRIRVLDDNNALAYYSWKMFWYRREFPTDTIKKEIGLMTLKAKKIENNWKWVAITNQYTPWFYDKIEPVFID